jgi:hypothetical protein
LDVDCCLLISLNIFIKRYSVKRWGVHGAPKKEIQGRNHR